MRSFAPVFALCVLAVGCAHAPAPVAAAPPVHDTPELVVSPPPRTLYRYVGRVEGVAPQVLSFYLKSSVKYLRRSGSLT